MDVVPVGRCSRRRPFCCPCASMAPVSGRPCFVCLSSKGTSGLLEARASTLLSPCSSLCVAPQQPYLCFAHLSHYCLLWNGTVNVSDGDKSRWTSTPSFVWCLFCYPSLTLSLPSSLEASKARSLSSSQVYTLEGEKSFKQTASLLFGQTPAL